MGDKKQTNFSARDQLRHTKEVKGQNFFEEKHMDQERGITGLQKFNMQFFSGDEGGKKLTKLQKGILAGLVVVAVGIMCTFIGPQLNSNKDIAMTTPVAEASTVTKEDKSGYDTQIERRLEGILKQIEGVGNVEVMVTLAETKEIVLAEEMNQTQEKTEEKDSTNGTRTINKESTQNKVVMADGNKPYIVKEEMPKISGVLVVAEGGDDINIKNTIIQSVSSLLDIPVHKVSIFKMGKN